MSSASCEIWTRDGRLIGYGDYSGTSDTLAPGIVAEAKNWHDADGWDVDCECSERTDAWAYCFYGAGFHWPVTVCERCRVLIAPWGPYEPDWGYAPIGMTAERREAWKAEVAWWKNYSAEGWPKDGPPPGVTDMDERHED